METIKTFLTSSPISSVHRNHNGLFKFKLSRFFKNSRRVYFFEPSVECLFAEVPARIRAEMIDDVFTYTPCKKAFQCVGLEARALLI